MTMQYTIYFAGPLFDHKILQGNALLASHIENVSQGRYRCVLPQNLEQRGVSSLEIRDQNLRALMQCDLALFNFDGSDLDSGTVAEYMYAKTLDIPSVILRTDFRYGGDQEPEGNPWNIMVSFYPRTFALHPRCHAAIYGRFFRGWQRAGGLRAHSTADCDGGCRYA